MKNENKEYVRPTLRRIDAVTATTLLEDAVKAGNRGACELLRVRQEQRSVAPINTSNNQPVAG